jgi:hypothetical protein
MRKIAILKYFLRKRMFALGCCLLTVSSPHAQLPVQIIESHSALQLENSTEFNADGEPQDDGNWQNLEQYSRAPLNLNTADEAELSEFFFLTPLQIQNFLQYRKRLGELLSVYELQAVPGWAWDIRDMQLERGFEALLNYIEDHGDALVPKSYSLGGFKLGSWVGEQRQSRRNKPP